MPQLNYAQLEYPMRRHIRACFGQLGGISSAVLEQQVRFEHRIRTSGLKDRLIHLLAGVQDSQMRAAEPFEVFVMGEGKHGKSTFINAVLGTHAAPTDWLPKTWCFNRYIAVHARSGDVRIFVDPVRLETEGGPELRGLLGEPEREFRTLLEYHVGSDQAKVIASIEEDRVVGTLGSTKPYFSPVMEMEWAVVAPQALLPGIRLVDTMGINQQLAPSSHLHHLKWQYERADAVIWIVAAEKIGARELRNEMLEARRYAKHLVLVINKWDQLDEPSRQRALIRSEREYGGLVSSIVPFSSLLATMARQGLSPDPSEDELAWALEYAHMDQEHILERSGLPRLQESLIRFLDGRLVITKNLQMYSALRQKAREFRGMVLHAKSDAEANLELRNEMVVRTERAAAEAGDSILESFRSLALSALSRAKEGILAVTYDSRRKARNLMQLEAVNNDVRILMQNEALGASARYAGVITWLSTSSKAYRESQFEATGRVAECLATQCTTLTKVRVEPARANWRIPDPDDVIRDFLIKAGELLSGLPILGVFIVEKVLEAKAKATQEIRQALERDMLPQVQGLVNAARNELLEANRRVACALEHDVVQQFEATGGEVLHKRTIADAQEALTGPVVEPLLVALPVRTLRRLGWPRS